MGKTAKIGKPQKSKRHKKLKKTIDTANDRHVMNIGKGKQFNLPVNEIEIDKQDVPRKTKELLESIQTIGNNKKKRKKMMNLKNKLKKEAAQYGSLPGMTKPLEPVPIFVRGKKETEKAFLRRVELETQRVVLKSKIDDKFKIGNTKPDKAEQQLDELKKRKRMDPSSSANEEMVKKGPSERKRERDRERKKKKSLAQKQKKMDKELDFNAFKDEVEFGEVAMAPPLLTAKPRSADTDPSKPRPGKKSLLLKSMLDSGGDSTTTIDSVNPTTAVKSFAERQLGQSVKRKHLSPAQRQIADYERQRAIDLYKTIRDKKYERNNLKT